MNLDATYAWRSKHGMELWATSGCLFLATDMFPLGLREPLAPFELLDLFIHACVAQAVAHTGHSPDGLGPEPGSLVEAVRKRKNVSTCASARTFSVLRSNSQPLRLSNQIAKFKLQTLTDIAGI